MVILFKSDKSLIITKPGKLYQKENAVDKLIFYCPKTFNDLDIELFTPTLSYVNAANEAYVEVLGWVESDKDGYLRAQLPATTKITNLAGELTMHLTLTYQDLETETSHILKSSDLTIVIDAWEDYFRFTPSDAFTSLDNKLLEIDTEIQKLKDVSESLDKDIPTDLMLTDDKLLQLQVDGTPKGEGVEIYAPEIDLDGDQDGELSIDDVPPTNDGELDLG